MADLDDLEYRLLQAREARREIVRKRQQRRNKLAIEAEARIAAQLDAEFPELAVALRDEAECQKAFDEAAIEARKEALLRLGNYGVLVEWKRHDRNRYNLSKRYWSYPTGRRAVIEMYTHETQLPENFPRWRTINPGDLFLRRVKKSGEKSLQILMVLNNPQIPSNWYPEGEKPKTAAPDE